MFGANFMLIACSDIEKEKQVRFAWVMVPCYMYGKSGKPDF